MFLSKMSGQKKIGCQICGLAFFSCDSARYFLNKNASF